MPEQCFGCTNPIEGEEPEWIQGLPHHSKCLSAILKEHPEYPWTDIITGEVDWDEMEEGLDIDTGRYDDGPLEDGYFF